MIFNDAKKLGFGLMRLPLLDPEDKGSIDVEQMKVMVDSFIERGFTYFDTAWMYCKFESENATRKALVERYPREAYTLTTKLHSNYIETKEDRDKVFYEQCKKTGVDYFDYYLIHDIEEDHYVKYNELDCFEWLKEKKEAGLVKHIGFSFHDTPELLERVLTEHPEMEFVQLQINYLDWESESVQSRKCYEVACKYGKPVIVMEPVKGGTLANVPMEVEKLFKSYHPDMSVASWAVRYAASLENVKMVLSGMSNTEQLDDNTAYMSEFQPLNDQEKEMILEAVDIIEGKISIPCTGCAYCVDGCPMNIPIPTYFSLYNEAQKGEDADYLAASESFGKASECIACKQCEGICPQHLPITSYLKDVESKFE